MCALNIATYIKKFSALTKLEVNTLNSYSSSKEKKSSKEIGMILKIHF